MEQSDVATKHGTLSMPATQEAGRGRGSFFLEPSEGAWPCQYLFQLSLLTSRTVREKISAVLSHAVCDN